MCLCNANVWWLWWWCNAGWCSLVLKENKDEGWCVTGTLSSWLLHPSSPPSVLFSSAIELQMVSLIVHLSHPSWTFIFVSFLFSYVGAEMIFIANLSWDVSIAMATVGDLMLSFQASQILWNVTEVLSEELKKLYTCQTERRGLKSASSGQEAYWQTRTEAAFRPSICLAVSPHVKQLLQFFMSQTLCAKCLSDVAFDFDESLIFNDQQTEVQENLSVRTHL